MDVRAGRRLDVRPVRGSTSPDRGLERRRSWSRRQRPGGRPRATSPRRPATGRSRRRTGRCRTAASGAGPTPSANSTAAAPRSGSLVHLPRSAVQSCCWSSPGCARSRGPSLMSAVRVLVSTDGAAPTPPLRLAEASMSRGGARCRGLRPSHPLATVATTRARTSSSCHMRALRQQPATAQQQDTGRRAAPASRQSAAPASAEKNTATASSTAPAAPSRPPSPRVAPACPGARGGRPGAGRVTESSMQVATTRSTATTAHADQARARLGPSGGALGARRQPAAT